MRLIDLTMDELKTLGTMLCATEIPLVTAMRRVTVMGMDIDVEGVAKVGYTFTRVDGVWRFREDPAYPDIIEGIAKLRFEGDEDAFRSDLVMLKLGFR
jgi:hypothetical protein